ncbi:hypothetical protein JB92DRAFT_3108228 [Gautieria morchelliformis]|nr:hypothetical protein JB92DRAFT_3108228 [Gautieria morchelliformis]
MAHHIQYPFTIPIAKIHPVIHPNLVQTPQEDMFDITHAQSMEGVMKSLVYMHDKNQVSHDVVEMARNHATIIRNTLKYSTPQFDEGGNAAIITVLNHLCLAVDCINGAVDTNTVAMHAMDVCFNGIDQRFGSIDQPFDGIYQPFDGIDECFGGIDQCFHSIDQGVKIGF